MEAWPTLIATGLVVTAGAFLVQVWSQTVIEPSRTAIILAIEPLLAVATAALVLDERLSVRGWVGAGLMIAGTYVVLVFAPPEDADIRTAEALSEAHRLSALPQPPQEPHRARDERRKDSDDHTHDDEEFSTGEHTRRTRSEAIGAHPQPCAARNQIDQNRSGDCNHHDQKGEKYPKDDANESHRPRVPLPLALLRIPPSCTVHLGKQKGHRDHRPPAIPCRELHG
jgi:hypothetical protein